MKVNLTEAQSLGGELQFAAYACLDTTGTREIFDTLQSRLSAEQERIYAWSRAQLSPALAMGLRGVKVDETERRKALAAITADLQETVKRLRALPGVATVWDAAEKETGFCPKGGRSIRGELLQRHKWPRAAKGAPALPLHSMTCERCGVARLRPSLFEPGSNQQIKHLLYKLHNVPKQYGKTGELSTDKEALQKIRKRRPKLAELCDLLLHYSDLAKQQGFLNAKLSPSGRFHSSFNVAAAWTGRWSSSKDPFQRGGNLQNIGEQHRYIFIPDTGKLIGYADLKTAESMKVAYMSGCEAYIEAHKQDVHTYVCRLVWPNLPWTGDIEKDTEIAKKILPTWDNIPGHNYRFQAKRIQHGSNFGLTPFGMAIIAHIPVRECASAQNAYFTAFPEIRDWQKSVIERVSSQLPIYNTLQRSVRLFGRPWDGHTHKQGLAFGPQGSIGDVLNLGLWKLWKQYDPHLIQVLAQVHDAVLHQFDPRQQDAVAAAIKECMLIPIDVTDIKGTTRSCTIPVEWAVGRNWGKAGPGNPGGLTEVSLDK